MIQNEKGEMVPTPLTADQKVEFHRVFAALLAYIAKEQKCPAIKRLEFDFNEKAFPAFIESGLLTGTAWFYIPTIEGLQWFGGEQAQSLITAANILIKYLQDVYRNNLDRSGTNWRLVAMLPEAKQAFEAVEGSPFLDTEGKFNESYFRLILAILSWGQASLSKVPGVRGTTSNHEYPVEAISLEKPVMTAPVYGFEYVEPKLPEPVKTEEPAPATPTEPTPEATPVS